MSVMDNKRVLDVKRDFNFIIYCLADADTDADIDMCMDDF